MSHPVRTLRKELSRHLELWIIFSIGVLLRIQYLLSTPFSIRGYDTGGHIEYIAYVLKHWNIPKTYNGWEMHQAPLYYFLSALWVKAKLWIVPGGSYWKIVPVLSLLFSILALAVCIRIAHQLFPKPKQRIQACLFLGMVAVLPGIVFFSSRISNDTLVTLILFAFTAALLDWWNSGKDSQWYLCILLVSLGILAKLSAGTALPVLLICLAFRPGIGRQKKYVLAGRGLMIVLLLTGWLLAMRMHDGFIGRLVMPGTMGLNGKLLVPHDFTDMFSFSPIRILVTTYNDPWTDMYARRFFWEFFFKSAFFGEWRFLFALQWLHRALLAGGLFTLLLAAVGIVRDVRRKGAYRLPLLLTLGAGLGSLFLLRFLHSAACSQDFRYVPQVAIPIIAYACIGLDALTPRWRTAATAMLTVFCFLCSIFLLSLSPIR